MMGVNKLMIPICQEYLSEEENIFMIYINTNTIDKFTNKTKKKGKRTLMKNIPFFPEDNIKLLHENLSVIKNQIDEDKKRKIKLISNELVQEELDFYTRKIFINSMNKLFGDYYKFLKI